MLLENRILMTSMRSNYENNENDDYNIKIATAKTKGQRILRQK